MQITPKPGARQRSAIHLAPARGSLCKAHTYVKHPEIGAWIKESCSHGAPRYIPGLQEVTTRFPTLKEVNAAH